MEKFIKKTLLWCFLFLSLMVTITLVVINHYKDYYGLVKKAKHTTFLLADSHGLRINLENIGVDNLSYGSNSYVDIKNQLSWLVKNKDFDRVILTYDEQMFSSYRDNLNNNHLSYFLNPIPISAFRANFIVKYCAVFKKLISSGTIKLVFQSRGNFKSSKKESVDTLEEGDRINKAKNRIELQFKEKSLVQENAFNDILGICKKNNIEVILIKFPLSQTYINERAKNKNYKALKEIINPLLNLDLSISISDDRFYRDEDHLNEDGISILEKLISDSIDKP
ncbi:hypothetical protein [Lutimonas sp.]|uniref:hypothetical protein n=1 Tax=Lutimonas sp. TaxID=1872403 RepID=UPI003D9BBEFB